MTIPNPIGKEYTNKLKEEISMKPRKVVVTVELMSGESIKDLKDTMKQVFGETVKQVQVNVITDK